MPKVKGKGDKLTAKFDGKAKKQINDLSTSNCLVLISIKDKEECTGHYFKATAHEAINTFKNTTFLMVDRAHWHNLKVDSDESPDALMQKADQLGDKWFLENENTFFELLDIKKENIDGYDTSSVQEKIRLINQIAQNKSKSFKIIRWPEWQNLSYERQKDKEEVFDLFENTPVLKNAIHLTATDFAHRHCKTNPTKFAKYYEASKNYLLEECYSIMHTGAKLGNHFIAYPGVINQALLATWQFFVEPNFLNSMHWLHINFKRISSENDTQSHLDPTLDVILNPNNNKAFLAQNKHHFFSTHEIQRKLESLPKNHYEKIMRLALAFGYLLELNSEKENDKEHVKFNSTFNNYTDLLISLVAENAEKISSGIQPEM